MQEQAEENEGHPATYGEESAVAEDGEGGGGAREGATAEREKGNNIRQQSPRLRQRAPATANCLTDNVLSVCRSSAGRGVGLNRKACGGINTLQGRKG